MSPEVFQAVKQFVRAAERVGRTYGVTHMVTVRHAGNHVDFVPRQKRDIPVARLVCQAVLDSISQPATVDWPGTPFYRDGIVAARITVE